MFMFQQVIKKAIYVQPKYYVVYLNKINIYAEFSLKFSKSKQ